MQFTSESEARAAAGGKVRDNSRDKGDRLFARLVEARGHQAKAPLRDRLRTLGAGAIAALLRGLEHPDPFARWEAVNLLGELAPADCRQRLVTYALNETEVHARWRSFWAVARLPRKETIAQLVPALKSPRWGRRWNAALILTMMERPEALPVLQEAFKSPDTHTVWEALSAAGALGHEAMAAPVARMIATRHGQALRQQAVLALGRIGGRRARAALARALDDPEPGVRWRASMALSGLGADSGSLLRARLEHETDKNVVRQLKEDLGKWEKRDGDAERRAGA